MKTFNQLTVGDKFYNVYRDEMKFTEKEVQGVSGSKLQYGYSNDNTIPRFKTDKGEEKEYSRYGSDNVNYYFVNKCDAIRFCKARMMKTLFKLVDNAKEQIEGIRKFR